jgi:hypothetical protein
MKRLLTILFVVLVALTGAARVSESARTPLVLAFYYAWFDENSWKPTQLPDLPAAQYSSRDPQAVARQIGQAKGAGIDAFVVSWLGARNLTESNFKTVLDQARAAGFRAAIDFEVTAPAYRSREDVTQSLGYVLGSHAKHPAYLRVDGKPVIFFWREQKYTVDAWRSIRSAVDPNRQSLWIAEGVDASYLSVFDGHHLYSVAWAKDVGAELRKWGTRTRSYGADKVWVATVMPGNDDTRTKRQGAYVRDRRGGEFYRETWRGALSSSPDWIMITSWNEWPEGTMIEPSVTFGDLYLNITREFAGRFKANQPAPTALPKRAAPTPRPPTPLPGSVRAKTTDTLRVRAGPSTGARILGRLREGAWIDLLARNEAADWLQIAYPDTSRRGWIAAEYVLADGNISLVPVIWMLPQSQPTATLALTPSPVAQAEGENGPEEPPP